MKKILFFIFFVVLAWGTSRSACTYRRVSKHFQIDQQRPHFFKDGKKKCINCLHKQSVCFFCPFSIKPFSQQNYVMQATGPPITGLSCNNTLKSKHNLLHSNTGLLLLLQVMRVRQVCPCPLVPPLGRAETSPAPSCECWSSLPF